MNEMEKDIELEATENSAIDVEYFEKLNQVAKEMDSLTDDEKEDLIDEFINSNPEAFMEFQRALLSGGPMIPKTRKSLYTKKQLTRDEIKARRTKNKKNKKNGRRGKK